jgi:hypothetical protein
MHMDMSRIVDNVIPRVHRLPRTLARRSLNRQPTGGDIRRARSFQSRATFDRVHVGESIVVQCSACCATHKGGSSRIGECGMVKLWSR